MTQEYDKIVKENTLPSITTLLQKTISVHIVKYEVIYPELAYTVDKEANFILLATDIQGIEKLYHIKFQVKNDANRLWSAKKARNKNVLVGLLVYCKNSLNLLPKI